MFKRALILIALAGTACRPSNAPEPTLPATAAQPAEAAAPTQATTAAQPSDETASGGEVTIEDAADYEAKGLEMMDKLVLAFTSAGTDCDKAAANVTAFIGEYGAMLLAIKKFEDANPDAKQAMDEKMRDKAEELIGKIMPVFAACQDHEGLKAAMAKMP